VWAACGDNFDLLGDVCHVSVVALRWGMRPIAWRRGQPLWRGLRHGADRRGRPPWGGTWCGACLAVSGGGGGEGRLDVLIGYAGCPLVVELWWG
jgi:hypothetical protein